jgi:xanthine dehydrogenase accessory factor
VALSILAEMVATRVAAVPPTHLPAAPAVGTAVDPVCGMDVVISATALQATHADTVYYFCGSGCKVAFVDDPHRYLAADE